MTRVPLKKLHPAPWNPRTLRESRFVNLCKSIEADPGLLDLRPILATKDGTIYAGNMRYRAVQHLGWADVPTVLSDIPEQLAKERALRDNGSWGEWVEDDLGHLLAELKDAGSDIDLLGFDSPELDRLLNSVTQVPEEDEADLEPPTDPITKPGDLWLLGEHRLLCGDSTNITDVERLMNGTAIGLVVTDPPYGVDYTGENPTMFYGNGRAGRAREAIRGDTSIDEATRLLSSALALTPPSLVLVWHAPQFHAQVRSAVESTGMIFFTLIVWNKNQANFAQMGARYKPKFELALGAKRSTIPWYGPDNETTVWDIPRLSTNDLHPTQKPPECFGRFLRNHTQRGDTAYDPFAGSGPLIVAAEQTDRIAYLMELDPGYCDVIVNRWQKLTSKTATLAN